MNIREQHNRTIPPRIGVFVIAYNAAAHIRATLARIPSSFMDAVSVVYVVDDCSHDETVDEALLCQRDIPKLQVLRNRINQRYGGNQKIGYQYSIDKELDVVVMLHADGQYAPECLSDICQPIIDDQADVVIGSRMMERGRALQGGMPKYKYIGNRILTGIQNAMTRMNLSEFHSGYRAYRVSLLRGIPFLENSDEWHFDTQILLQAHHYGARILEVPIPTYYGDEICHVNGTVYAVNCVVTSLLYRLHVRGLFYSRKYDFSRDCCHYTDKFSDPYSSHSRITMFLGDQSLSRARVLDLGVGDCSIVKWLKGQGCRVDAVEIDEKSAQLAKPYCDHVHVADLDSIAGLQLSSQYDYVIAADVLEHLRQPEVVLSYIKRALKQKGVLLVSLPNVANIYVRANILLGRFPYHTKGILDRTHLHFYTSSTARQMLVRAGWDVTREYVTPIPLAIIFPFLGRHFRWVLSCYYQFSRLFKGLLAYQLIFICENPNKSELL